MMATDSRLSGNSLCDLGVLNTVIAISGLYFGQAENSRVYIENASSLTDGIENDEEEDLDYGNDEDVVGDDYEFDGIGYKGQEEGEIEEEEMHLENDEELLYRKRKGQDAGLSVFRQPQSQKTN